MPDSHNFLDNEIALEKKANIFKALGHPTRLMIVEAVSHGELCVCDIQSLAKLDMSTVSKHLTILKNANILASEKRGKFIFYNLRCDCIKNFIKQLDNI
ncbi:metalloregulator ArsR/SmtB family transcription factor [Lentisphaerota bacterium WC36G]|nr:metalloregulator ArsR/SmtB family transcription factor [Lentisphaerae bacterium WC36]